MWMISDIVLVIVRQALAPAGHCVRQSRLSVSMSISSIVTCIPDTYPVYVGMRKRRGRCVNTRQQR